MVCQHRSPRGRRSSPWSRPLTFSFRALILICVFSSTTFATDIAKSIAASCQGWRVVRCFCPRTARAERKHLDRSLPYHRRTPFSWILWSSSGSEIYCGGVMCVRVIFCLWASLFCARRWTGRGKHSLRWLYFLHVAHSRLGTIASSSERQSGRVDLCLHPPSPPARSSSPVQSPFPIFIKILRNSILSSRLRESGIWACPEFTGLPVQ